MTPQEQELSWHVASHISRARSNDWYWGFGCIALVGAAVSVFFGNWTLGVIILLGAGSMVYLITQTPREHSVTLSSRGISIDGTRYPYKAIHSFWVEHTEGPTRLFISLNGFLVPHFSLYLADPAHPDAVRAYLKKHIPEEEQGPQAGEHIAEIFGL